jgi:hypothetical protein
VSPANKGDHSQGRFGTDGSILPFWAGVGRVSILWRWVAATHYSANIAETGNCTEQIESPKNLKQLASRLGSPYKVTVNYLPAFQQPTVARQENTFLAGGNPR